MKIYFEVAKFSFQWFLVYPLEFASEIVKRVLQVIFILLFWKLIVEQNDTLMSIEEIITYFIIVGAISDFIMVERLEFGRELSKLIRYGSITNFLIRPLSTLLYVYSSSIGDRMANIGYSIISLVIAFLISQSYSLQSILLFLPFLGMGILIGLGINLIIGSIAFYVTDTTHLEFLTQIIIRIFSGAFIPLAFYSENIQRILELSPFPHLVYLPISILTNSYSGNLAQDFLVGVFWGTILLALGSLLWKKSLRNYEATGL